MPAHPSPHRNARRLRRLAALAFLVSLTACGSCKRDEEPAQVVVDEAGLRPRAMRRPFDRHHRDAGIPLLPTIGTIPHPSASTGAPAPPIE